MNKKNTMTGVVILNYNNYQDTINCIESVEKFNTSAVKYMIVDNGSASIDAVKEISLYIADKFGYEGDIIEEGDALMSATLKRATFLISKSNSGYAQGNNKGLKLLETDDEVDNILILNNDILFVEDIIPSLIKLQSSKTECAIVSPILYKRNMDGIDYNCARLNHSVWEIILTQLFLYRDFRGMVKNMTQGRMLLQHNSNVSDDNTIEIELPSGSCMLVKKELFSRIGWFDPNTFLYFEENILYKRISKLGLKSYLATSCKCIHLGASSTSATRKAFILNAGLKSSRYYLRTYEQLTLPQKLTLQLATVVMGLKLLLMQLLKV